MKLGGRGSRSLERGKTYTFVMYFLPARSRGWLDSLAREELQQHFLAEQPDRAQDLLLAHPRPLDTEDHRRDAEPLPTARDLLDHAGGVADDEAVARELSEAGVECLPGRQRLVLLPAAVRAVLRSD